MFCGGSMEEGKPRQLQQHQHMSQSDEVDSAGKNGKNCKEDRRTAGDVPIIEVMKRRRGRSPGSKNKQKPPAVVTREAEAAAALQPHVFEIPGGQDLVYSLGQFSRRRNLGLYVLSGTGAVANVTLRQLAHLGAEAPAPAPAAAATVLRGRFEILSISATFLPPTMAAVLSASVDGIAISLAGPQGQIVGGRVAGQLVKAGTVVVVAAVFSSPTFHRLPGDGGGRDGVGFRRRLGGKLRRCTSRAYVSNGRRATNTSGGARGRRQVWKSQAAEWPLITEGKFHRIRSVRRRRLTDG